MPIKTKRKKINWGGKRPWSGRKPKFDKPMGKPTTIRLPDSDFEFLKTLSANVSDAIHSLIQLFKEKSQ